MLRLYYFPGNASLVAHIVLEEIGAPFELTQVDRARGAHKSADYLRLNPNGLIPVLVDGDIVLYETAAIVLHLADTHPAAGLAPALGTAARAQLYKWLVWCTNSMQAMLMHYFYPQRMVDESDAAAAAQVKTHAEMRIGGLLDQVEAELAAHGADWLLGATYSAVDPLLFVLCRWTRGFARPARSLPHVGPYLQRMLARPAVQRAFDTEQLVPPLV
jgi:glutathione S-transferase